MDFALLPGLVVGAVGLRQAGDAGHHRDGGTNVLVAVRHRQLPRHVADIASLIGIRRERHDDAVLFEVTQPGRQPEDVHLAPGIIDVILARHVPAGEAQQVRQGRAIGGTAPVADVQRAGRVGGNVLYLHLLPAAELRAPELVARDQHGADDVDLGPRIEREVDESRPRHLGPADQPRSRQLGQQQPGDFARILPQRLGQLHRQVGGEIAMRRVARSFNVDRRVGRRRRNADQRLLQQFGQPGFDIVGH